MALHPNADYLHIGCDEVFQMGECDKCRLELHETLFLKHIHNVALIVRKKYPNLKLIIWDDMLRHLNQQTMIDVHLGDIVEPMIWVYAEDIYRFVQPQVWDKYSKVFKSAWTASAFKGAFGETLMVPNAKRHLENNIRWLEIMAQQSSIFKNGFQGIVLTGWQRYDHFAVLCELLPASLPSLALSLITVSNGYFSHNLKEKLLSVLTCPQPSSRHAAVINLEIDPYLWDKLGRCMFPGSPFFRLTYRIRAAESEALSYLKMTKRHKGWLTDFNIRHNFTSPLRIDELTAELPRLYHGLISLAKLTADAMGDLFDLPTISEWIEQRMYPHIINLETLQNQSISLKNANEWPSRPLPPLKDLERLGIILPTH